MKFDLYNRWKTPHGPTKYSASGSNTNMIDSGICAPFVLSDKTQVLMNRYACFVLNSETGLWKADTYIGNTNAYTVYPDGVVICLDYTRRKVYRRNIGDNSYGTVVLTLESSREVDTRLYKTKNYLIATCKDPSDSNSFYLHLSNDEGLTWTTGKVNEISSSTSVRRIIELPNGNVVVISTYKVHVSTDGGNTFNSISSFDTKIKNFIGLTNTGLIISNNSTDLYKTTDGITYTLLGYTDLEQVLGIAKNGTLIGCYHVVDGASTMYLKISKDDGDTWTTVRTIANCSGFDYGPSYQAADVMTGADYGWTYLYSVDLDWGNLLVLNANVAASDLTTPELLYSTTNGESWIAFNGYNNQHASTIYGRFDVTDLGDNSILIRYMYNDNGTTPMYYYRFVKFYEGSSYPQMDCIYDKSEYRFQFKRVGDVLYKLHFSGDVTGTSYCYPLHSINASYVSHGSLSVASEAEADEVVKVTATPATGYKLKAIKVNGTNITGTSFTMPAEDVTVSAEFEKLYTVTVAPGSHGTLSVTSASAVEGDLIGITATPDSGYKLKAIKVNGAAITGTSFTMPTANVTVSAEFEKLYIVTVDSVSHGSLSVVSEAKANEVIGVVATPASGYKLKAIKVNGTAITGTSFTMPAANVTVSAEFVENVPTTMDNKYLNEQGLAKVISLAKAGHMQIFTGTQAEWDALSDSEKNQYDMAEVVN